ncbi:MAG TPA: NAD(P)-binding protein, partial [Vicinamibacteria bacterium]|nr:NAD(P)-binding protein [Vicinamibacteria bacterium]
MDVNRRDFLNGMAVALTSSLLPTSSVEAFRRALQAEAYPPTLTGLRGSHPGSFEVAHALLDGKSWGSPVDVDGVYDLVVVGGGLSGLAAAHFFRKQRGPRARVLVLDNHDDFGGHAKRNEFWHQGRMYLMNGGTLNVEAPSQYSTVAAGLLWELGIDRTRYFEAIEAVSSRDRKLGLTPAMFFDRETFGIDRLVTGYRTKSIETFLDETPLAKKVRGDIARLYQSPGPYLQGLSSEEKKKRLARMSYRDFLVDVADCDPGVVPFFNTRPMGLFCIGIDALPALYAWEMGYPGFDGMALEPTPPERLLSEPGGQHGRESSERADSGDPDMYFPDGNATIARLLVRALIPSAVPGKTMEDVVTARVDYGRLDRDDHPVRIRLESTAIRVEHRGADEVAVTYVKGRKPCRARARA